MMPRTAPSPSSDLRSQSPLRTPDWRWREAQEHIHHNTSPGDWEDAGIARAHQFLIAHGLVETQGEDVELCLRCPVLSAAHYIYTEGEFRKDELEARLLCQSPQDISTAMKIRVDVIRTYAILFFDVLDVRHTTDWLLYEAANVREWNHRDPTEGEIWKYMALAGGPVIVNLLVADFRAPLYSEGDANHLLAEKARFMAREFSAMLRRGSGP